MPSSLDEVAVYKKGDEEARQPAKLFLQRQEEDVDYTITSRGDNVSVLSNKNFSEYYEFPLKVSGEIEVSEIELTFQESVPLEGISLYLSPNVSLPNFIEVESLSGNEKRIILSKKEVSSRTIQFPMTDARSFTLRLYHSQPLRLTEIKPFYKEKKRATEESVRFLAQPGYSYEVFVDADRFVPSAEAESPQFFSDEDMVQIEPSEKRANNLYRKSDGDGDGIPDEKDNCIKYKNPSQEDVNGNGRGDACDDFDKDGIVNINDNCINNPNRNQSDEDMDGIGDVCDKEESRFFERYSWILPVSIGGVALIVVFLMLQTMRVRKK